MNDSLAPARARASSRLAPPSTPLASVVIHLAVFAIWIALFACVFGLGGVLAWSIGLAYLAYDAALQVFTGWQIRKIAGTPPAPDLEGARPRSRVAVLVAARNEATVLPATVAALLGQRDPPDEIVIADDGSDDGTAEYLCSLGIVAPNFGAASAPVVSGATSLIWLRLRHGGKANALNEALVVTDADVVVTVDADTLLEPGALGAVRGAFIREPELAGVTGIITPVCGPSPVGRVMEWFQVYEYIRNFLARYAWMRIDCLQLISGAFAAFRRTPVVAVGGFDDSCLVEDYELIARMQRYAGENDLAWRFRVLGDAQARTEAPGSVPAFLSQRRRWFGGFLQTQWWYRAMVGDRRFGRLGAVMLPVKALDTVQPLYGLTALGLLVYFIATGRVAILGPVLVVVIGKLVLDISFQVWSLCVYRRWVGDQQRASLLGAAFAGAVQPFTFQLLLQAGALLGWVAFLTGAGRWGRQTRFGLH